MYFALGLLCSRTARSRPTRGAAIWPRIGRAPVCSALRSLDRASPVDGADPRGAIGQIAAPRVGLDLVVEVRILGLLPVGRRRIGEVGEHVLRTGIALLAHDQIEAYSGCGNLT